MNKIWKAITGGKAIKPQPVKRTTPITAAFTNEGECLGHITGDNAALAFEQFPTATILNIIPVRGRTKIVRK